MQIANCGSGEGAFNAKEHFHHKDAVSDLGIIIMWSALIMFDHNHDV